MRREKKEWAKKRGLPRPVAAYLLMPRRGTTTVDLSNVSASIPAWCRAVRSARLTAAGPIRYVVHGEPAFVVEARLVNEQVNARRLELGEKRAQEERGRRC